MIFPIKLRSDFLKLFALIAMTLDHINRIFIHTDFLSTSIGRTAFPIFSFLLLSNFCTYHPVKKYIFRLSFFAVLTEVIFYIFHFEARWNILFTFLNALIFLELAEKNDGQDYSLFLKRYFLILLFLSFLSFTPMLSYGPMGFFFLIALYAYFKDKSKLNYFAVLLSGFFINFGSIVAIFWTLLTLIILLSGIQIVRKPRLINKWFFYIYYPLHLLLLHLLKVFWEFL